MAYGNTPGRSLAEIADAAEVGDWLTQIIQIIMIFCANLSRQREVIPATRCERTLAEIADTAER